MKIIKTQLGHSTKRPVRCYIFSENQFKKLRTKPNLFCFELFPASILLFSDFKILDKESFLGLSPFKIFTRGCYWPVATPVPDSKSIHPTIHSKFLESIQKKVLFWNVIFFLNLKFQECVLFPVQLRDFPYQILLM